MTSAKFKILALKTSTFSFLFEELKRQLPPNCTLIIPSSSTEDEILRLMNDVDIIIGSRVSGKMIASAQKLKMIQATGTGVDRTDIDAATDRGVIVCNSVGQNAIPVAEHTMALMLDLAKNITQHNKHLRDKNWQRMPSTLIKGKTLGIVGLGAIGVEVASMAKAFGMRIIATKRYPSEKLRLKLGLTFLGGQDDFQYILRESDFVVLSIPLTPETRKMISEKELRMMKRSASIINISRGGVIDEEALIRVLNEGIVAGAGLDVFEIEPINPDNPLLKLENVVLTPHVAGGAGIKELIAEHAKFIVQNIKKVINGQKPKNIIDPTLRYAVKTNSNK